MKRVWIIVLAVLLVFSLTACNAKEKAAEKVVEDIINDNSDSDVDVDIDGDTVTVDSEDEDFSVTMGKTDWPTGDVAKMLPECKDGSVTYVLEMTDAVNISVSDISESQYEDYLTRVQNAGFDQNVTTMDSEGSFMYTATDSDGYTIVLAYYSDEELMTIIFSIAQ